MVQIVLESSSGIWHWQKFDSSVGMENHLSVICRTGLVRLSIGPSVNRPVGPSVIRSVGPAVRRGGPSVGRSVLRSVGSSAHRPIDRSVRRSVVLKCTRTFQAAYRHDHSTKAALLKWLVIFNILSIDASLLGLSCIAWPQLAILLTTPFC